MDHLKWPSKYVTSSLSAATTLHSLFWTTATNYPHNLAVVYDDLDQKCFLSYQQLANFSDQVANAIEDLFEHQTVDEVIGLYSKQDLALLPALLGILTSSAAYTPIDLSLPTCDQDDWLDKLQISTVIVEEDLIQDFKRLKWTEDVRTKKIHGPNSINLLLVRRMSHTNQERKNNSDIVFLASPLTFDPSVVQIFIALATGAAILIAPNEIKIRPRQLCKVLFHRNKITVFQVTPSMLYNFGNDLIKSDILSKSTSLKILAIGGEPFPEMKFLRNCYHPACKVQIFNLYGITEVSSWATYYRADLISDDNIPLGLPITDTILEIYDDNGHKISQGMGVLWIGGKRRICYINDENFICDKTMRSSGDYVRKDENGFIWYIGRRDCQIKRQGKRINLKSIKEEILRKMPSVLNCHLIADENKQWCRLVAFITTSLDRSDYDEYSKTVIEIRKNLKGVLSTNSNPDDVHVVEHLPLTNNGKIDDKALLQYHRLNFYADYNQSLLQYIDTIWKKCTNLDEQIEPITADEATFLSNGSSINAVRLVNLIEDWLESKYSGLKLPKLLDFILHKSFKDVYRYVSGEIANFIELNNESIAAIEDSKRDKRQLIDNNSDLETSSSKRIKFILPSINNQINNMIRYVKKGNIMEAFGKFVYIGSHFHIFAAINMDSGEILWETILGDRIESSATVSVCGKYVIVGCYDHRVYTLDRTTGAIVWQFVTNGPVKSSPLTDPETGLIWIGSHDHYVYALNITGKCARFRIDCKDGSCFSSPCLGTSPRLLYTATLAGTILAIDPDNGNIFWQFHCSRAIFSSPCVIPAGICVGCTNGTIIALDNEGSEKTFKWFYR
ncbi:uncharacterized protein TRIADDRAFT_56341 [Trichoplax adhaerens]|uniref:AMP-dependent synthetase/ligase domain-containing protein n=1 Tax=Trichoplax adhaerens TaxID=10228 RepID=B3RXV2_TRIAD|nr:hypothetical protein TRIADDRAFT_56341 [Trichoplax adhaerens]EDV24494.1 hypothetical protein TRIADDRAFT_56341 [Trichoplax adhaerens]|eukprot:XP_002112384.1 hypothetical protein TRIADDRAFT_56341 [Trichoplax adhaerens]